MDNNLTDRQFWINYWESKKDLVFEVPKSFPFMNLLANTIQKQKSQNLLEIGGFPGYYSVWCIKNTKIEATLLDYVVHQQILNDLEQQNGLDKGVVKIIETDLFEYQPSKEFDIVFSNGLIEHFEDTKSILQKHVESLKKGGVLVVSLPNFKSLNGWFQKTFDPENYNKHNIKCMDLDLLKNVCQQLHLNNIEVKYDGLFTIWIENEKQKPLWLRLLKKTIWLPLKIIFKLLQIETKAFSPYIIITATK